MPRVEKGLISKQAFETVSFPLKINTTAPSTIPMSIIRRNAYLNPYSDLLKKKFNM
jgi:hypothetical protein